MNSLSKNKSLGYGWLCVICLMLASIAGCKKSTQAAKPPPTDVEVVEVEQKDVPIYGQWIGTLDGFVNANVKAQVTGYLLRQEYKEGSLVKKGQLLFQIDPRPFQATLDQTKAQLAQAQAQLVNAEANQRKSQLDVERYTPLAKQQAATQQDLDNAIQTNLANRASVETSKAQIQAAKAAVETAQINLNFTRVVSPIDGVAGLAQNQVGDLVSAGSSSPITTVSTVDPIKVYFTPSEQEYLTFNRQFPTAASREAEERRLPIQLILADGTTYAHEGRVQFANRQVDQSTGTIQIAALFPNPGNILRPGGYGQVRASTRTQRGALLVPQRAVSDVQGSYQVAVLDGENKVSVRSVKVGDRVGNMWIIADGLKPGERVVAEGVQKVAPGVQVNPKPFTAPTTAAKGG
ncbi:MAG: efflux transporter, family, subunit [Candidatus Angelobacter sp.]|nr:efflux transporter, family, subunit [Candidatus Angelobacter sp.]